MRFGKWLSNVYDPRLPDARRHFIYSLDTYNSGRAAMNTEWQQHLDWINKNVIGPPKATEKYTRQILEANDLVGIYAHPK